MYIVQRMINGKDVQLVRITWLDALRGVAAVMVAVMHLWERVKWAYPQETDTCWGKITDLIVSSGWNWGKSGVVIFFIVSGYVIPFSLKNKGLRDFWFSRFFRLYPAYWLSILLVVLVGGSIPAVLTLIMNVTMFQKFVGVSDMIGVYWTLQIELIFYMLCSLLFCKKLLKSGGGICRDLHGIGIIFRPVDCPLCHRNETPRGFNPRTYLDVCGYAMAYES
jgi:peptidoglycan/LPS O-acetylase OafA/YrhL